MRFKMIVANMENPLRKSCARVSIRTKGAYHDIGAVAL